MGDPRSALAVQKMFPGAYGYRVATPRSPKPVVPARRKPACFTDLGAVDGYDAFVLGAGVDLFLVPQSGPTLERWSVGSTPALVDASYAPVSAYNILWWLTGQGSAGPFYYLITNVGDPDTAAKYLRKTYPGGPDSLVATLTDWTHEFESGGVVLSVADGVIYAYDESGAAPGSPTYGLFSIGTASGTVTRITHSALQMNVNDKMVMTSDGAVWWTVSNGGKELHRYTIADGETILDLSTFGAAPAGMGPLRSDPTKVWVADNNSSTVSPYSFTGSVIAQGPPVCKTYDDPPLGNIDPYNGSRWNANWTRFVVGVNPEMWAATVG